MNLTRWREIMTRHYIGSTWDGIGDETIDAIVYEIAGIVSEAQRKRGKK